MFMAGYLAFLLLLFGFDPSPLPCCGGTMGLKEADVVFTGTVINILNVNDAQPHYFITFKVEKYYKGGGERDTISINAPINALINLGMHKSTFYRVGENYEVYTKRGNDTLYTTVCSSTHHIPH